MSNRFSKYGHENKHFGEMDACKKIDMSLTLILFMVATINVGRRVEQ